MSRLSNYQERKWLICLVTLRLKQNLSCSRSSEVEHLVEAQGVESSKLSESIYLRYNKLKEVFIYA